MRYHFNIIAFLLLFLAVECAWTQSPPYHPFPGNRTFLYTMGEPDPQGNSYFAARMDSIRLEATDTAHYLYRIDRTLLPTDTLFACWGSPLEEYMNAFLRNRDHCFGQKLLYRPGGDCYFATSDGDSFLLKSWAGAGQSWTFHGSETATVDSIVAGMVLGQPDSVKYISISNGRHIQLSRSFGFVRAYSFLPLSAWGGVADTLDFVLWGIPELSLGGHFPTYSEHFYQHQVGDQWLYRQVEGHFAVSYYQGYLMRDVLTSQLGPNQFLGEADAVHFVHTAVSIDSTYFPPGGQGTVTFDSVGLSHLFWLPYAHHAQTGNSTPWIQRGISNSLAQHGRFKFSFNWVHEFDSCANAYMDGIMADIRYNYLSGVGGREILQTWEGGDYNYTVLMCYELGAETWGTCLDLSTLVGLDAKKPNSFTLYPNPTAHIVEIAFGSLAEDAPKTITFTHLDGRKMMVVKVPAGIHEFQVPLDGMADGIYGVLLEMKGEARLFRRLVVRK